MSRNFDENARIADDIQNAYEEGYADGKRDAVVHGHWIKIANGRHECSICHINAPSFMDGKENKSCYCPLCGAKMDLLDDDTRVEVTENGVKVTKYNCTKEEIEEVKAIMGEKVTE